MERRDLYDVNRQLTGKTILKGDPIPPNNYILVVLSFIQNSKGQFLIQKRSPEKNGKYGSTGGHAKTGENSLQAMKTEIKEEIGLDILDEELKFVYSGVSHETQVFYDLYYLKKDFDIDSLVLQKEEVDFVDWYTLEEIEDLIKKDLFLSNHVDELYKVLEILEKEK